MRGDRGEVLERLDGLLAALLVARAQRRGQDLLQERRLAVGRRPEGPQVAPAADQTACTSDPETATSVPSALVGERDRSDSSVAGPNGTTMPAGASLGCATAPRLQICVSGANEARSTADASSPSAVVRFGAPSGRVTGMSVGPSWAGKPK